MTETFVGGITAFGESLPPLFKFITKATDKFCEKIHYLLLQNMVQVLVNFDCEEGKYNPVTIGMNEKGGMEDEELEKYILYLIYNIFPDVSY